MLKCSLYREDEKMEIYPDVKGLQPNDFFCVKAAMKSNLWTIVAAVALLIGAFGWYRARQPRFGVGETAPNFAVTLADGRTAQLSDLRGKVVLLQFWGSWCGPCRAENPHLVTLYHQYRDRGFEIFSIGVETSADAWRKAIARDGMVWPYHSVDEQQFGGAVARQYNVHSIPATFLILPNGTIAGVNLSPNQIGKILAEQL
jgi:peroxiredoxin